MLLMTTNMTIVCVSLCMQHKSSRQVAAPTGARSLQPLVTGRIAAKRQSAGIVFTQ